MFKEINGIRITGFSRELNLKMWETLNSEQISFLKELNKDVLYAETQKVLSKNGFVGKLIEDKVLVVNGEILGETDDGIFRIR